MRVVFFGTPSFAAHVLEYLLEHKVNVVAVVSKPDRPKGRSGTCVPTPVKAVALAQNPPLQIYQPDIVSAPEMTQIIKSCHADLFVVVAYGEIIKEHLLDIPFKGCINLHASLLPKYRGAAPIQRSIIQGEIETGVTIIYMVKKMDAGDMIERVKVSIGPDSTFGDLEEALREAGQRLLLKVLHLFEQGIPEGMPQQGSEASFAPKIELKDCEIRWERPAQELHNLVRGVNPYPGAWCYIKVLGQRKRLKILQTRITPCQKTEPGIVLSANEIKGNLLIATGDQALELLDVQLEGKKRMSSEELTRGLPRKQLSFTLASDQEGIL